MSQHTHHQRQSQAKAIAIAQEQQQAHDQNTFRLAVLAAGFLAATFAATALQHAPVSAVNQPAPAPISLSVLDR